MLALCSLGTLRPRISPGLLWAKLKNLIKVPVMEARFLSRDLKLLSIWFDYLYCRLHAIIFTNLFNMLKSYMLDKMTTRVMMLTVNVSVLLLTNAIANTLILFSFVGYAGMENSFVGIARRIQKVAHWADRFAFDCDKNVTNFFWEVLGVKGLSLIVSIKIQRVSSAVGFFSRKRTQRKSDY